MLAIHTFLNLQSLHSADTSALFESLRFSLFGEAYPQASETRPDWNQVFMEASRQTVLPLVYEAGLGLPEARRPSDEILGLHRNAVIRRVIDNERLMAAQDEVLAAFQKAGIPCVVLKGSSAARFYPKPELRVLGDIDLLVERGLMGQASEALLSLGYQPTVVNELYHHGFRKGKAMVELHFEAFSAPESPIGLEIKNTMADAVGLALLAEMNGYSFPVLSPERQAISLLLHLYFHMAGSGVGLRQVCDFAVFARSVPPDTWERDIAPVLRRCGILRFAEVLTKACVMFLGLPASLVPWCLDVKETLAEALMEDFLLSGNFGVKQASQRASVILSADKEGKGRQGLMPLIALRNINQYARRNYKLARAVPVLLPVFWVYLPLRYLYAGKKKGQKDTASQIWFEGRRRKRLFDALAVFKPDTRV